MRLLLASASPRRRELLAAAGFDFDVDAPVVDERRLPGEAARVYVERVAREKAAAAARAHPQRIVVAADTAVVLAAGADGPEGADAEEEVFGKPTDRPDAARMLRRLSGRSHQVLTAVVVVARGAAAVSVEQTDVWFDALSDQDIETYVATGEPMDKAGAYAIQGLASRFITRIEGSYANVVGLPVSTVVSLLRLLGLDGVS